MSKKKGLVILAAFIGLLTGGIPLNVKAALVGPFVADTAEPTEAQKLVFQVLPSFFIKQGAFDGDGNRQSLPGGDRQHQLNTIIKPVYGLFPNFEISVEIPVQYNWVTQGERSANSGGVGDVLLGGKYRFLESDKYGLTPSIAGIARIKFPFGKYENLAGDKLGSDRTGNGSYEYFAGINVSKSVGDWAFHANLIYDWVAETTIDGVKTKPGNIWNINLAVEYSFSKNFSFLLELLGLEQGKREENNQTMAGSEARLVSLMPALGWEINEKMFVLLGCSFGILGKNSDYGFTPALLFNYNF